MPELFTGLEDLVSQHPVVSLIALAVVSLAIYAASCMLSIRIFEKEGRLAGSLREKHVAFVE